MDYNMDYIAKFMDTITEEDIDNMKSLIYESTFITQTNYYYGDVNINRIIIVTDRKNLEKIACIATKCVWKDDDLCTEMKELLNNNVIKCAIPRLVKNHKISYLIPFDKIYPDTKCKVIMVPPVCIIYLTEGGICE